MIAPQAHALERYRESDRRDIAGRWTLTFNLETVTASQIGSHESDNSDQTFGRSEEGLPVLYGTTMCGALRSAANDLQNGYRSSDADDTRYLFGFAQSDHDGTGEPHESRLVFFDSVASGLAKTGTRDGVCLEPEYRRARDGGKYDREVALPGVEFSIRIDLVLTADDTEHENHYLSLLCSVVDQLRCGFVMFGARKSRGMGSCVAKGFRAKRYDLMGSAGWKDYACSPHDCIPLAGQRAYETPGDAAAAAGSGCKCVTAIEDRRSRFSLSMDLALDSTLLIRSPGTKPDDPDSVHLSENGNCIVSGTSLAGALRAHALRIHNTLSDLNILKSPVDLGCLFGPTPDQLEAGARPAASRLQVGETVIVGADSPILSRVKIDRFTGGTVDGALFEEQPASGGNVRIDLEIHYPSDAEIGLIALVLRDLIAGLLPVGGGSAVGRGVLRGDGSVVGSMPDGTGIAHLCELMRYVDALVRSGDKEPPQ